MYETHSLVNRLSFHEIHGPGFTLSTLNHEAKCTNPCGNSFLFSSRPLKVHEKLSVKITECSKSGESFISFAFTTTDPEKLALEHENFYGNLNYMDLLNKESGFWGCSLDRKYCVVNNILTFYLNSKGNIIACVNGDKKLKFSKNIPTDGVFLWACLYANSSLICLRLISHEINLKYQQKSSDFLIKKIHEIRGKHVELKKSGAIKLERCTSKNKTKKQTQENYFFTDKPLLIDETCVLKILQTDNKSQIDNFQLGLTSCDPESLKSDDFLPKDSKMLLNRPEYWVVVMKDNTTAWNFNKDDEISLTIHKNGALKIIKNGSEDLKTVVVHHTIKLWAFFIISGRIRKVQILSSLKVEERAKFHSSSECSVCFEKISDAVLYPCGHVCLCFECAQNQWQGQGKCVICRRTITDVIKIFKM